MIFFEVGIMGGGLLKKGEGERSMSEYPAHYVMACACIVHDRTSE